MTHPRLRTPLLARLAASSRKAALVLLAAGSAVFVASPALQAETGTTTTIHQFSPPAPHAGLIQATDGNYYGTTGGDGIHGFGTVFKMTAAGALTTIHSFNGPDGFYPQANLIQGTDGVLYGTTVQGGLHNQGTVFKVTTAGVFTSLHSFDDDNKSDGVSPRSALVQGRDGFFYGTTSNGGVVDDFFYNQGTVFRISSTGVFTSLHAFGYQEANDLYGGLVQGNDGNFYGVGDFGGVNGSGAVFRITPTGAMTTIYSFNNATSDASGPISALVLGNDGNFYGTSSQGGTNGAGTVYRVTPAGGYKTLYSFNSTDGKDPEASLVKASDGNFYGTTAEGGQFGSGTVFRVTPGGALTVLHSFDYATTNYEPLGSLVQGTDGFLYGTTFMSLKSIYHGSIFRISTAGEFTTLSTFAGTDGAFPMTGVVQGKDGNLYGTTYYGGDYGVGTVYKMTATGAPTTLHSFNTTDGRQPSGGVIQATDGNFYGVTLYGGTNDTGTMFRITASGTHTLLYSFTPATGYDPSVSLVQAKDGFLYGVTSSSGPNYNGGVFRISTTGAFANVHYFNSTSTDEGYNPAGPLIQAADGNFYGALVYGGTNAIGSVYKVTPAGAFTTLHSFDGTDGRYPDGPLVQGTDGNFYGATTSGGPNGAFNGTIYRITPAGALTTLHTFNNTDGSGASGMTQGGDGYFYGLTSSGGANADGTIFRMTPGGVFASLHSFDYSTCSAPVGTMVKATDGSFYGVLSGGGWGDGGVFKFSLTPNLTSAATATGTVGQVFTYQTTASPAATSFAATNLPPGLSINTTTGKITGTPTTAGTYAVKLSLTNASGTTTATLTITVKSAPPVITSALNPPAKVNTAFSYQITATNNPTSYSATSLPPGLSINTTTGKITGTPTTAGTYSTGIKATNVSGTGSATMSIVVKPLAPVITSNLNPPSRQGVAFSYQITATNTPTSYGASGLPAGLTISTTTGKITGKPTKAGTYAVTIAAFNSGGSGSAKLNLVVKPPA